MNLVDAMKTAISETWQDNLLFSPGQLDQSVCEGKTDPGGWCPGALLIVTHENGIPGPMDEEGYCMVKEMFPDATVKTNDEKWHEICTRVEELTGQKIYFEPVNMAVTSFLEA